MHFIGAREGVDSIGALTASSGRAGLGTGNLLVEGRYQRGGTDDEGSPRVDDHRATEDFGAVEVSLARDCPVGLLGNGGVGDSAVVLFGIETAEIEFGALLREAKSKDGAGDDFLARELKVE